MIIIVGVGLARTGQNTSTKNTSSSRLQVQQAEAGRRHWFSLPKTGNARTHAVPSQSQAAAPYQYTSITTPSWWGERCMHLHPFAHPSKTVGAAFVSCSSLPQIWMHACLVFNFCLV